MSKDLQESCLDEVLKMLQDPNPRAELQRVGILTAENPRGESADEEESRDEHLHRMSVRIGMIHVHHKQVEGKLREKIEAHNNLRELRILSNNSKFMNPMTKF